MANPPARHPAFEHYNPFTDTTLDPPDAEGLFRYPGLPPWLHDTVARAKQLTGPLSGAALEELAYRVDRMASDGIIPNAQRVEATEATGRDYVPSDESDCLHAYLDSGACSEPLETWPALFGVLALRLAGDILTDIQRSPPEPPTRAASEAVGAPLSKTNTATYSTNALQGTVEALRAVAVGEGLAASLRELRRRQINRANAGNSPAGKSALCEQYISWVERLGQTHTYRYQSHAEDDFLAWVRLEHPDLAPHISARTPETLRHHLRKHCKEEGKPYPFP